MSWEVLTMRSVTSFFNPALARSDLRRHWPILFLYTAIWMVALPVQLYLRHIAEGASYGTRTVSEVCQGTYSMGVIMAFVFGGVLAMALYSYLMNGRSVGLIHSLPLKRQTLFFTQLLTALLAAVCVCVRMDVAGVERRVPKTSEIESISVQCSRANSFTATSEDTETIEAIRAIHRAVLDQMKDGDVDLDGALVEDGQYIWIRLKYTLTDGSALERAYNVPVSYTHLTLPTTPYV